MAEMARPADQRRLITMLITGANGFIGGRLATLALGRAYVVRTLTRSDWAEGPGVPVEERFFGTYPDGIPLEALRGVDVVVHCAASLAPGSRGAAAVNVEGTLRLAKLASESGVGAFIFISSQSARPDAESSYGRTKYWAEQELTSLRGSMRIVILRPGLVTGGGRRGLFQRLCRVVETMPVIPLLGGGRAIVQPIHVDDLCAAIFRCAETASQFDRRVLRLGHPDGLSLAAFLQTVATVRLGRHKPTIVLPLWPVEIALRVSGRLRLPLPITTNNVNGLKTVERMRTEEDLRALGIALRPLDAMIRDTVGPSEHQATSPKERAVRVLLIGAGRIGLVHALVLSRLHGIVLAGIVDPKRQATGLLRGMGVTAPTFERVDEAFAATSPDAAVVATPPATHLPLARECLSRGAALLIEKPLAIRAEQLPEYEDLAQEFPGHPIHVGYVMTRNPHVAAALAALRQGRFGKARGFVGLTLISLVHAPGTSRWEVKHEVSGGGSLINAGGHLLSMIHAAFGRPQTVEAQVSKLHSPEVEDSAVITFHYPDFSGRHYCSWSIEGYARQENTLRIWTDRGQLIITGSVAVFVADDGEIDVMHQLDFDVGFNVAPDYAGAGFSTEHHDLRDAIRTGQPAASGLTEGIGVERLLFDTYRSAVTVRTFADGGHPVPRVAPRQSGESVGLTPAPPPRPVQHGVQRVLDLRELPLDTPIGPPSLEWARDTWDGYAVHPAHLRMVRTRLGDRQLRVTLPDFLNDSRLISNGRYGDLLARIGVGGALGAVRKAIGLLPTERGATFWVAAIGLLGAALHAVPRDFGGTLLLHGYLVDLALTLRRLEMLDRMLVICRRSRPRARVGFHTNMAEEALAALWSLETPVDEISVLTAPNAHNMSATLGRIRRAVSPRSIRITAEVGLAPALVHQTAATSPDRWAHGADAVLINLWADPVLARQRAEELEREWRKAFPGLGLPDGVV